jgi:hypothetical protein
LVGWYLMFPILDPKSWRPIPLPLSQWHNEGSYDSARECMQGREDVINQFKKDKMPQPAWEAMVVLGQCIATDDPRLKEK